MLRVPTSLRRTLAVRPFPALAFLVALGVSCGSPDAHTAPPAVAPSSAGASGPVASPATPGPATPGPATPGAPPGTESSPKLVATGAAPTRAKEAPPPRDPRREFRTWLEERLPTGGRVVDDAGKPLTVIHVTKAGDTLQSIAKAYLDLVDVYFADDFAKEIEKSNRHVRWTWKIPAGQEVAIPHLLAEPYKTGDAERLGWPEDKVMKGIFLHSDSKDRFFYALEKMPARGMNAIVLDAKDYDGWFTYPSKVPIARESGATKPAMIRDFARVVRFAHKKGIRIIARICCFHDPHSAARVPRLSIKGKWGGAYPVGWLDPAGAEAQEYIFDVIREVLDTGVDEIQLDYVRFPVQKGLGNAQLPEAGMARRTVIRDFVRKAHEITKARGVPLSLDVFGVIAFGRQVDIDNLGQDLAMLAPECEALSPMVYPSHYAAGFHGWDEPGDHPEIVGIGTKASIEQIRAGGVEGGAIVRPWAQAMKYKSPSFGPKYIADEIRTAEEAGAVGWLLWNPAEGYDTGYAAAQLTTKRASR